jgi:hypothetical protein
MKQGLRRGIVMLGFVLALAPLSAFADQVSNEANSDAINAANAQKAWLQNLPAMQAGVALGQMEIANARAMAQIVPYDSHAQARIPNTMTQYNQYCDAVTQQVAAKVANANEMVAMRPGDPHAQAELANATAMSKALWSIIGDSYPGNPWSTLASPQTPVYASDTAIVADERMTADDQALVADDAVVTSDVTDDAVVANDVVGDQ